MRALPRRTPFNVSVKGTTFHKMLVRYHGGHIVDPRISLTLQERFDVCRMSEPWICFDLITGKRESLILSPGGYAGHGKYHAQAYDIATGLAYARTQPRKDRISYVMHINSFLDDAAPLDHFETLDVARDTWLGCDVARAATLLKPILPASYELYLACLRREVDYLKGQVT